MNDSVGKKIDNELSAVSLFLNNISEKYSLSFEEIIGLIAKQREEDSTLKIPSCIFRERMGIMESVVKYLKEEHKLNYHDIALLLKRDDRVIWATYNHAIKKKKSKFNVKEPSRFIPVSIFTQEALGPLESLTKYLKDSEGFSLIQISSLLNRDPRTIWSSYNHSKEKQK